MAFYVKQRGNDYEIFSKNHKIWILTATDPEILSATPLSSMWLYEIHTPSVGYGTTRVHDGYFRNINGVVTFTKGAIRKSRAYRTGKFELYYI